MGPLPPPNILAEYEAITPGLSDRIVGMAENQAGHRQKMERRLVTIDGGMGISGLMLAFTVVMTGIVFGGMLILKGMNIAGFFAGMVPLGTVGAIFLYTKRKNSEAEEKD